MLNKIYKKLNIFFKLAFNDEATEAYFQKSYLTKNIRQNRLATLLAITVNILYIPVVYLVMPKDFILSLQIVFFIILPTGILFLWLSSKKISNTHIILYLFYTMVFIGSGVVLALYFTHDYHKLHYTIFILPIIGIFLMSGAPFIISLLSIIILIIAFIPAIVYSNMRLEDNIFAFFLLSSTFLFTAISSYLTEKSHRNNFLSISTQKKLNKQLKEQKRKASFQEQIIKQQTRLAQMGEMISMIAHQWRQPLAAISAVSTNIQIKLELDTLDFTQKTNRDSFIKNTLKELESIDAQVATLSETIDDFRNFYKPQKKISYLTLEAIVTKALNIIEPILSNDKISLIKEFHSNTKLELYDNEMVHVVLSIIKNSQDNFLEKKIKNPYIKIEIIETTLSIYDNGGGIANTILDKIFDPYFSTKDEKNGTGLGLHMSKTIVEEHNKGMLHAVNTEDGVCFIIDFEKA